jgi:hypothetical protein
VWRIEDVLEVYTRPDDPNRPQVCMDEVSKQLLAHARPVRLPGVQRATEARIKLKRLYPSNDV